MLTQDKKTSRRNKIRLEKKEGLPQMPRGSLKGSRKDDTNIYGGGSLFGFVLKPYFPSHHLLMKGSVTKSECSSFDPSEVKLGIV